MKKILSVILAVVLVFALGVTVMANSNQLPSPMGGSPRLVKFTVDGDCDAILIVTPYAYRNTLPSELLAMIDEAYSILLSTEDYTKLCSGLKELAKKNDINPESISVSEIFDIRYENCVNEADHNGFHITLESDALKGFVALVHYNGSSWEIIDATVEGNDIYFYADDFSPFAILVGEENEGSSSNTPATSDAFNIILCVAVLVICAAAIVVLVLKKKKANK